MLTLKVRDFTLDLELFAHDAPDTVAILKAAIPIETTLYAHSIWSGRSAQFEVPGLDRLTALEAPVSSVYPGTLVARPDEGMVMISYGPSECRSELGLDYGVRVGQVSGDNVAAFLEYLDHMHYVDGDQRIQIGRRHP